MLALCHLVISKFSIFQVDFCLRMLNQVVVKNIIPIFTAQKLVEIHENEYDHLCMDNFCT